MRLWPLGLRLVSPGDQRFRVIASDGTEFCDIIAPDARGAIDFVREFTDLPYGLELDDFTEWKAEVDG
jgi:hypothetical protein